MISKATEELTKKEVSKKMSKSLKQANFFQNLLLGVSIFLVLVTAFLHLDLVPPVLLGCTVVGFNYFLTIKFVRKLLLEKKLQALDIIFILSKFGISVLVLFGALEYFELSANGLLIGISNVAIATIIFIIFRVINPKKLI